MNRSSVAGTLGMQELAQLHRPCDRDAMRAACLELAARGMSDHTIAAATGMAVEQVRRLIGERHQAAA